MRLSVRMRALELRLRPPQKLEAASAVDRELLDQQMVSDIAAIGCDTHLKDGELGRITVGEWFQRFSDDELVVIHADALRQLAPTNRRPAVRSSEDCLP